MGVKTEVKTEVEEYRFDITVGYQSGDVFSRDKAALSEGVSVHPSVGPSVCRAFAFRHRSDAYPAL